MDLLRLLDEQAVDGRDPLAPPPLDLRAGQDQRHGQADPVVDDGDGVGDQEVPVDDGVADQGVVGVAPALAAEEAVHPGQEHGAAQEVQGADLVGHGHLVGDHRGPQDDRQIHCHQPGIGGARLGGARGGGDGGDGARGVQSRRRERGRRNRWRAHGWGARRARGRNRRGRRGRRRPAEPGPVLPVRIGLGPRCVGDRCALGPGRGGPAPDLLPAPVLDLLLGRGGVVLPAGRGGIGAALGADQDVAGAVAVGAVRADAPHEQAGQGQQEPGGPPPVLVPDQRAPVDVGVEKSGRGAQGARAGPLDEP